MDDNPADLDDEDKNTANSCDCKTRVISKKTVEYLQEFGGATTEIRTIQKAVELKDCQEEYRQGITTYTLFIDLLFI